MEHIEVSYAASNRCRCSVCYQMIHKHEIKIGHVMVRRPDCKRNQ